MPATLKERTPHAADRFQPGGAALVQPMDGRAQRVSPFLSTLIRVERWVVRATPAMASLSTPGICHSFWQASQTAFQNTSGSCSASPVRWNNKVRSARGTWRSVAAQIKNQCADGLCSVRRLPESAQRSCYPSRSLLQRFSCCSADISNPSVPPGFMMLCGSKCSFKARITSIWQCRSGLPAREQVCLPTPW